MNYEKNFSNDIATSSQPEHRNTSPKQNDRPENYHYNAPAQHQPSAPNFVSPLSSSVPPLNTSTQQSFVQFSNTQQPPPYNTQQPVNQQAPPYNTQQPVNQQTQPYFGQPIHYQQSPAYYGQPFNQHSNLVVLPPATVTLGSYSCFNFTMAIVLSCITIWFYGVIFGVIAFTLAIIGQDQASKGLENSARSYLKASYIFSIIGIVIAIVLIIVVVTTTVAVPSRQTYYYYNPYNRYNGK